MTCLFQLVQAQPPRLPEFSRGMCDSNHCARFASVEPTGGKGFWGHTTLLVTVVTVFPSPASSRPVLAPIWGPISGR